MRIGTLLLLCLISLGCQPSTPTPPAPASPPAATAPADPAVPRLPKPQLQTLRPRKGPRSNPIPSASSRHNGLWAGSHEQLGNDEPAYATARRGFIGTVFTCIFLGARLRTRPV